MVYLGFIGAHVIRRKAELQWASPYRLQPEWVPHRCAKSLNFEKIENLELGVFKKIKIVKIAMR
jgi:hypothetical protein